MILRVPEYYMDFSCIADQCNDSCCAGWEIDIDEGSYAYYKSCEGEFGNFLRENMYKSESGYRFCLQDATTGKSKGKRCAMLNDDNLCDLYTALGEEALCEVCTEYPRFLLLYGNVMQKGLSFSCEEAGRMIFTRNTPVRFVEYEMEDAEDFGDMPEESEQENEEDEEYICFMEQVQKKAFEILQNRKFSIRERMCHFLLWAEHTQDVTNHYQAYQNVEILKKGLQNWRADMTELPRQEIRYEDFMDRFFIFTDMEVLDNEWIHIIDGFNKMFNKDSYKQMLSEYLVSQEFIPVWYEHILVYFTFRYLMNAVYDFDILSYAKLAVVATLVIRDMDVLRWYEKSGQYTVEDRIDIARIFSKEVEHSEGNADALKEMCMMEEIAAVENLYRQI